MDPVSFNRALLDFGALVEARAADQSAAIAEEIRHAAAERTPVKTGRAQAGWHVTRTGAGDFTIENDVYYIYFLEHGHGRRPGHHMLALSVAEAETRYTR